MSFDIILDLLQSILELYQNCTTYFAFLPDMETFHHGAFHHSIALPFGHIDLT